MAISCKGQRRTHDLVGEKHGDQTYVLNRYSRIPVTQPQENTNTVFRLVDSVYDMDMYVFKLNVFTKQVKYD